MSKLKRMLAIAGVAAIPVLGACTPHQIEVFKSLPHDQQVKVIEAMQKNSKSSDCYSAINKHWHGDKNWARKIVHRESRNNPRAANPSSSARGCFQMLRMHDWRYPQVGCSASQKLEADCNTKAAWHLRTEAGRSPWAL